MRAAPMLGILVALVIVSAMFSVGSGRAQPAASTCAQDGNEGGGPSPHMPGSGFTCARSDLTGSKRRSRHSGASPASAAARGSADWSGSARRWQGRTWSSTYTPRHDTPADSSRTTNGRRAGPTGTSPRPSSPASCPAPGTHTLCASPGFARRARGSSRSTTTSSITSTFPARIGGFRCRGRCFMQATRTESSTAARSVSPASAPCRRWAKLDAFPARKDVVVHRPPQVQIRRPGHDQLHREESLVRFWHSRPA